MMRQTLFAYSMTYKIVEKIIYWKHPFRGMIYEMVYVPYVRWWRFWFAIPCCDSPFEFFSLWNCWEFSERWQAEELIQKRYPGIISLKEHECKYDCVEVKPGHWENRPKKKSGRSVPCSGAKWVDPPACGELII